MFASVWDGTLLLSFLNCVVLTFDLTSWRVLGSCCPDLYIVSWIEHEYRRAFGPRHPDSTPNPQYNIPLIWCEPNPKILLRNVPCWCPAWRHRKGPFLTPLFLETTTRGTSTPDFIVDEQKAVSSAVEMFREKWLEWEMKWTFSNFERLFSFQNFCFQISFWTVFLAVFSVLFYSVFCRPLGLLRSPNPFKIFYVLKLCFVNNF